jgi:hypothetical protein
MHQDSYQWSVKKLPVTSEEVSFTGNWKPKGVLAVLTTDD